MAELTFKSPGVATREIDLSGPTTIRPQGTPAGIIGTANQGPAFVPVTVATYQDFVAKFGATDGEKFGPLAMSEWMKSAKAGTYLRVLGVGDGKKRLSSAGTDSNSETIPAGGVKNAGFIVGGQQVKPNGYIGASQYARNLGPTYGVLGRQWFLGALMSESNGSTYFSKAGIQTSTRAVPILRGVLMMASGVVPALSGNYQLATTASLYAAADFGDGRNGGYNVGACNLSSTADYGFTMLLNGHKSTSTYPNTITASMAPKSANYFPKVMNTDPTKIQEAGHYLYTHYDIQPVIARVTGSGIVLSASIASREECLFLLTSSAGRNDTNAATANKVGTPNFDNYSDRFTHAVAPWVISQKFGGKNKNLFRVHALDAGNYANTLWKVSIENVQNSKLDDDYGTFDLLIRGFYDTDVEPQVFESFRGLDMNPESDNYVARRVGDVNTYFDFDKATASQKLVVEGTHPNMSVYIRVSVDSEVDAGTADKTAIPTGYRGYRHLVVSGSEIIASTPYPAQYDAASPSRAAVGGVLGLANSTIVKWGNNLVEPPVPMRENISQGTGTTKRVDSTLYWGTQMQEQSSVSEKNKSDIFNSGMVAYTKYFPNFATTTQKAWVGENAGKQDLGGTILDSDRYNNNIFSLERIQVHTKSSGDIVDNNEWAYAEYRRDGQKSSTLTRADGTNSTESRFLNAKKDFGETASKKFFKFSFVIQGGFNGTNIYNEDKSKLLDAACKREMDDSKQGKSIGATVGSYRKAIDIMAEKSDSDIQILAIPGIRETNVTDHALDKTEERFDAIYIMDIEERDEVNQVVTSSASTISVNLTVEDFKNRNLDSSFGAAYFPDCIMTDPATFTNVRCPPSVAVIGAFGLNDKVAYPWFAPAGFTRGALKNVSEAQVKLSRNNLDSLYDGDINPITAFPTSEGTVVFGQKTLLAAASALDRVNVRRLLIDVRRKVRKVADTFLFEPNRESTLARFSAQVNPILQRIQQQQGLDRFKVIIDTTTTTQTDIENNTVRGKIFLQPTRAVEFISLDFVVTNNGTEI